LLYVQAPDHSGIRDHFLAKIISDTSGPEIRRVQNEKTRPVEPGFLKWRARKGETATVEAPEELSPVERPKPQARAGNPTGTE
jgi:hypothetical protein